MSGKSILQKFHQSGGVALRLKRFFANLQKDLKVFVFLLAIICFYRAYFMAYMSEAIAPTTSIGDVLLSLWLGFRISLKSAGAMALFGFVFCTLPELVLLRLQLNRLRLWLGTVSSALLAVLFQARFPYYEVFHATFGREVVQGLHDDTQTIFSMMVESYALPMRLLLAVILTLVSYFLLRRLLCAKTIPLPESFVRRPWLAGGILFVLLPIFFICIRFGGSFNYAHSINWENASITSDPFLNECILDDVQAMYRVRDFYCNMQRGGSASLIDESRAEEYERFLGGDMTRTGDLQTSLTRTAKGARLPKPKHIFIILGETYAQWPMLDAYADLHGANGIKSLIAEEQAFYTQAFMPNGTFTLVAITGLVTGLSDVGMDLNYQPKSFREVYLTSMAPQFQRLGYRVEFWYGGFPEWDSIKKLSIAQGFDAFYGAPDYNAPRQNIWGTTDGHLFDALYLHLEEETPTVHLIMTISNHPPYDIDLAAEGIDVAEIEKALQGRTEKPKQLALEVGHYRYMDKVVTDFVRKTMAAYPDSLFVITGDHSIRMDPTVQPTLFEHESVPFVLYGNGVMKDILPEGVVGGHTSIVPTLIELIAPAGFSYTSIARSMTEGTRYAFNHDCWISREAMGNIDDERMELLPGVSAPQGDLTAEREAALYEVAAMRTISRLLLREQQDVREAP